MLFSLEENYSPIYFFYSGIQDICLRIFLKMYWHNIAEKGLRIIGRIFNTSVCSHNLPISFRQPNYSSDLRFLQIQKANFFRSLPIFSHNTPHIVSAPHVCWQFTLSGLCCILTIFVTISNLFFIYCLEEIFVKL